MPDKVATMRDAIADLVRDGDTVAIEGFTHLIGFSAGHEIIRQRKRDLVLARMTPDLIYDQMIAGGVARKLIFSWLGNPGVGGLNAIRRRIEPASLGGDPPLEIEEYSHFGMVARYTAGAANLPFMPLRSYFETDLPKANPLIREIRSPYSDETVYAVPPLNPDVSIIHAQRADASGNTQIWGLLGCQKEAAFAADRVIIVVEELVDEAVIRSDPNRTVIPGLIVDAVVVDPFGAHPSYVQGAYDRDNRFYLDWDPISRDEDAIQAWLREWVYDLPDRAAYVQKLGEAASRHPQAGLGTLGLRRLRGLPVSDLGFSKNEMMIVAAARELAGQRVCFVGVGLPNIAVNLAKRTIAPDMELVYEAGVFGARPARLPLSIGDPTIVTGATAVVSMFELFAFYLQRGLIDVGFLGAAQIDRFGNINTTVIGDYDAPEDPAAGLRRRLRDRDQCPERVRDHAPVLALVRRADRLPDLAREPRRGRAGRADPEGRRLEGARPVRGRHGPRDLALRRRRRDAARLPAPRRHPGRGPRDHRLGAADRPRARHDARAHRRRSCAWSGRSLTPRASTRSRARR